MTQYNRISVKNITNKNLSTTARGILCYLAAYADSSGTAFPSGKRILSELNISENGYRKHYRQLIDNGVISVSRKLCHVNRYHLKAAEGEKTAITFKEVMIDPSLSLSSKLLFTYLTSIMPGEHSKKELREAIGMSKFQFSKSILQLEKAGLIAIKMDIFTISVLITIDGYFQPKTPTVKYLRYENNTERQESEVQTVKYLRDEASNFCGTYQYNIINNTYQSTSQSIYREETERPTEKNTRKNKKISNLKDVLISAGHSEREVNCYIAALTKATAREKVKEQLSAILQTSTPEEFSINFLSRYERKTQNISVRHPIAYMTRMIEEYIDNYDALQAEADLSVSKNAEYTYTAEEKADDKEFVKNEIVDYNYLSKTESKSMLDPIVNIILEAFDPTAGPYKIHGVTHTGEEVKRKFLSLDSSHIEYVIEKIKAAKNIINPIPYVRTILFFAKDMMDLEEYRYNHCFEEETENPYYEYESISVYDYE